MANGRGFVDPVAVGLREARPPGRRPPAPLHRRPRPRLAAGSPLEPRPRWLLNGIARRGHRGAGGRCSPGGWWATGPGWSPASSPPSTRACGRGTARSSPSRSPALLRRSPPSARPTATWRPLGPPAPRCWAPSSAWPRSPAPSWGCWRPAHPGCSSPTSARAAGSVSSPCTGPSPWPSWSSWLAPWTAYNLSRFEQPVPLGTGLWRALAAGLVPRDDHGAATGLAIDLCLDELGVDEAAAEPLDESELDELYRRRALEPLSANAGRLPVRAGRPGRSHVPGSGRRPSRCATTRPASRESVGGRRVVRHLLPARRRSRCPAAVVLGRRRVRALPVDRLPVVIAVVSALRLRRRPRCPAPGRALLVVLAAVGVDAAVRRSSGDRAGRRSPARGTAPAAGPRRRPTRRSGPTTSGSGRHGSRAAAVGARAGRRRARRRRLAGGGGRCGPGEPTPRSDDERDRASTGPGVGIRPARRRTAARPAAAATGPTNDDDEPRSPARTRAHRAAMRPRRARP